jgi:hypothetical protein
MLAAQKLAAQMLAAQMLAAQMLAAQMLAALSLPLTAPSSLLQAVPAVIPRMLKAKMYFTPTMSLP